MPASHRHLALLLAAGVGVCPVVVHGQELAGTWRTGPESVAVTVAEWGASCGPRPQSRTAAGGHEITVRDDGHNLTLQGNRTNRSDRCWSDNRAVAIVSTAHPAPHRWVVSCSTPESEALGEHGTYALEATTATHLRFRDDTSYAWTIEGAHCRASSVLTREYDRTGVADAGSTPIARPVPPTPQPTPPVPSPSRCAHPGPPAMLVVSPVHRSVPAGARACFHAHVLDATRCEVFGQSVTWSQSAQSNAPEATMEAGCLVLPDGASSGAYTVSATAGALHGQSTVTVVTADAYRSLVAAHVEDPDAGIEAPLPGATSGTQFGTSNTGFARRPAAMAVPWPWIFLGGAGVLMMIAGALAMRRRPQTDAMGDSLPPQPYPSIDAPPQPVRPASPRRHAVELPAAPSDLPPPGPAPAPSAVQEPPPASPPVVAAEPAPAPVAQPTLRCEACGARYGSEMAFCPIDGTRLSGHDGAPAPVLVQAPAPVVPVETPSQNVCPTCNRRFAPPMQFCVEDGTALLPEGRPDGEK